MSHVAAPSAASRTAGGPARAGMPLLVWGLLYLAVGVALATASAWEIHRTPRLALVAAVGFAIGVGAVLLARLLRWRGATVPALAAAGYLLLVVPLAIPSALGSPVEVLRGVRDGVVGVVVGWKQLLTLSLPLGEYQAVLVPFFALVVAGCALAAFLIERDRRGTGAAAGIVVVLSAFGILFGGSATSAPLAFGVVRLPAPREIAIVVAVVLVSVVWLVGRARLRRAAALRAAQAQSSSVRQGAQTFALRLRRRIAGVLLVVVSLVAGLAIAPLAHSLAPRHALRDAVDPLLVVRQQPSPLSSYRAAFADDAFDAELFAVDAGPDVERLRLATLDSFEGAEFRVATGDDGVRFVRLPGGGDAGGSEVRVRIGTGYSGIWLPVPDGIVAAPRFEGERAAALADGFYLDAASGSAIDVAAGEAGFGLESGDAYTVTAGTAVRPDAFASEPGAQAGISADAYPQLAEWVERQGVARTGGGLAELVERLRARGYLSHALTDGDEPPAWVLALQAEAPYSFLSSRAGHSAARIEELFADLNDQEQRAGADAAPAALVAAVGDDEQFSTAVALLARYLGFESRVVVGVRLADSGQPDGVPACTDVCTGGNLTAWVEVASTTGGWAVFDVTPQYSVTPITISSGEQLPENPTVPDQTQSEPLDPPQAQRDDSESPDPEPLDGAAWWQVLLPVLRVVGTALLALALLLLPLAVLVGAKVLRRRGRRGDDPEVSMVGAWSELVAAYVDHGMPVPERVSRTAAAAAVARPRAAELATLVDRAVFAEHPPRPDEADAAWRFVDEERAELRAATPWRRRLAAAIAPASLLRDLGATRASIERHLPFLRKAVRP